MLQINVRSNLVKFKKFSLEYIAAYITLIHHSKNVFILYLPEGVRFLTMNQMLERKTIDIMYFQIMNILYLKYYLRYSDTNGFWFPNDFYRYCNNTYTTIIWMSLINKNFK